jgi:hypothetical protein
MKIINTFLLFIVICILAVIIVLIVVPHDMVHTNNMILFRIDTVIFGFNKGKFVYIESVDDIKWGLIKAGTKIINIFE